METKFCSFCAETHARAESTCSDECSTELIRTEFQENGDLERCCLWCPVRGDLARFTRQNLCSVCDKHRRRLGSCRSCGGSYGCGKCCHRCTPAQEILERDTTLRAFILLDVETRRARRFFSKGGYVQIPRDTVGVIEVSRARFERPSTTTWTDPTTLVSVESLEAPRDKYIEGRLSKLKFFANCGQNFAAKKWAQMYADETGATLESGMRVFERTKEHCREWGIEVKVERDYKWSVYTFDENAVNVLIAFYETTLKNKKMGYYW